MSKYINAEVIKGLMKNNRMMQGNAPIELWSQKVDEIIDNIPITSATVVEVVRCKDCKYYNEDKCWNFKGLDKIDGAVKANDFCSYGERIEQ